MSSYTFCLVNRLYIHLWYRIHILVNQWILVIIPQPSEVWIRWLTYFSLSVLIRLSFISNNSWIQSPYLKLIPKIRYISIPRFRVKYTMWSRKSYTVCDSNMIETYLMSRIQSCLAGRGIVISSCFTSSLCICHLKNVLKLLRTTYI